MNSRHAVFVGYHFERYLGWKGNYLLLPKQIWLVILTSFVAASKMFYSRKLYLFALSRFGGNTVPLFWANISILYEPMRSCLTDVFAGACHRRFSIDERRMRHTSFIKRLTIIIILSVAKYGSNVHGAVRAHNILSSIKRFSEHLSSAH